MKNIQPGKLCARSVFPHKRKKASGALLHHFEASKAATEQFLTARKSQWLPEQVGGLFLNIHYENQHLSCVTGLSLNQFTLDKTLEREWDESIRTFCEKKSCRLRNNGSPVLSGFQLHIFD